MMYIQILNNENVYKLIHSITSIGDNIIIFESIHYYTFIQQDLVCNY